jgi:hypothetical protein
MIKPGNRDTVDNQDISPRRLVRKAANRSRNTRATP